MARSDDLRIHVVRDPDTLSAFLAPLVRTPLAGGLGHAAPWVPAEDPAIFASTDAAGADYVLLPIAVSCLEVCDWRIYGGLSERGCLLARAVIEDALDIAAASLGRIAGRPDRIVFLQFGDHAEPFGPFTAGIVVKVSARRGTPRCVALPYYLEEFGWRTSQVHARPFENCTQDFVFLGDLANGPVRRALPDAVNALQRRGYRCDLETVGYHERQDVDRARFIDSLDRSRFILCPRGIGMNSLRFFEALAFGRIPVLLADEALLPLDWLIDWDSFTVRVPEAEIGQIADHVQAFLSRTSPAQASARARHAYEDHLTLANAGALIRTSLAHLEDCA